MKMATKTFTSMTALEKAIEASVKEAVEATAKTAQEEFTKCIDEQYYRDPGFIQMSIKGRVNF